MVLFGTAYPSTPPFLQGLLFAKLDTLGNVILFKHHADPDGDNFAAHLNANLLATSDGGYALTGTALNSNFGIFIKLSHIGEIAFYKKYDPAPNIQYQPRKVLELEDGYLILGHMSMQNGDIQVFLMKVDKQGNFLWKKSYGQMGVTEVPASLLKIDDNHYAIGSGRTKIALSPPYNSSNTWTKAWLIEVDSLGNLLNSMESQLNVQTGLGSLIKMPDGWLYTSAIFEIHNPFEFGTRGTILRTGDDINDVYWEQIIGTTSTWVNGMVDIKPVSDGNWVAVGQWATSSPPPPSVGPNYIGGSTFKFTPDGDSLWSRLDTAFWHPDCGSEQYIGGVEVLQSGSVIAAGYANSYCFDPERSYGWVLKISKDGCIDTLCVTTDLNSELLRQNVTVFPNPCREGTNVILHDYLPRNATITLYNATGCPALRQPLLTGWNSLDLSHVPPGLYFYEIKEEGRLLKSGMLVRVRE